LFSGTTTRSHRIDQHRNIQKLETLQHNLLSERPALIWFNVAGVPTGVDRRAMQRLRATATVAMLQLMRGGFVILELTKNLQAENFIMSCLPTQALTQRTIAHCNLGVQHPQSRRPSGAKTLFLTNIELTELEQCRCNKTPTDHVRYTTIQDLAVKRIMQESAACMITACIAVATTGKRMGVPEFNQINQQENQVDDQARKLHQVISIPSNTKSPTNINCNMATIKQFLDATHSKPLHNLTDEQLRQLGLHLPINPVTTAQAAYPTEKRIRRKRRKPN